MKINTPKGTYFVSWKYQDSELDTVCKKAGISSKKVAKMNYGELKRVLGVKELPKRETCTCFISDATGEVVAQHTVVRMFSDPYSKEYARKQSLKMALELSCEGKEFRKSIWENYLNRNNVGS